MNVVDLIKGQLTSVVMQKLASLLGVSEAKTESAIGVAVPGLLATLASMVQSSGGADKLATSINDIDANPQDSLGDWLTKKPQESLDQGGNLLDTLLSGDTISGLSASLASFSGIGVGNSKTLLGYLAPMLLGTISKQFADGPATAQGVQNFFADQQSNIAGSMPTGFEISGDSPTTGGHRTEREQAVAETNRPEYRSIQGADSDRSDGSVWRTLVPVAALAIGALFFAQYLNRPAEDAKTDAVADTDVPHTMMRPVLEESPIAIPDPEKFSADFASVYADGSQTLGSIKDVESAEAALPELTKLNDRIGSLSVMTDSLPELAKETIAKISGDQFGKFQEMIETVLSIPGVKPILEPILEGITSNLSKFDEWTK